jgi:DNA-binding response OmpR family regulator
MSARKVLLIEDNEELRKMYADVFERHNYTVYEAGDGQTGVDYALIYKPDAIILDLMLPRQGGLGALRVFRSNPELKHTPVFILTALPNPEYQQVAASLVQGYFLKTQIKPKELVETVSKALANL